MSAQGSCNDILELEIKPNQPPIELQRGPKSYSYGPLVKALELCRDTDASRGDTGRQHIEDGIEENEEEEGDGGLDAFLDACDNEQFEDEDEDEDDNEDDDFDDYLYNPSNNRSNDMTDATSSAQSSMISSDLHAIDALTETLQSVQAGLESNPLAEQFKNDNANEESTPAEDQYCSILIESEIQTVNFHLDIASELRRRLTSHTKEGGKTSDEAKYGKEQGNYDHINNVCDAFLSIRYPHLK